MPTARSNSQCPYCDHQSPAGSKFCNDCGAALHLRPCPHCGSVNDISLTALCSRCQGELGEPADAQVAQAAESTEPLTPPIEVAPAPPAEPAKVNRAPWLAVALLAGAVGAYFGLRPAPAPPPQLVAAEPLPAAASTVAVVTTAPASPAPAPVLAPAPDEPSKAAAPAVAASLARLAPPGAGRASVRREAALPIATAAPAPAAPTDRRSGTGLDLKQAQIGTCTEAVAALGLCTPDSTPRRP